MTPSTTPAETDVAIIGAGPVGLFAVFELGLLELRAHVFDALPEPGGQPGVLYPDKAIYDIPALPVCSGRELVAALRQQIAPFAPTFHLGQLVCALEQRPDGRWRLQTDAGDALIAKAVFIAAGTGAFMPRRLKLAGIEAFEGSQLFYRPLGGSALAGRHAVVLGDGDEALTQALALADAPAATRPSSVVLMHRRDGFQAEPALVAAMRARCASGALRFEVGQVQDFSTDAQQRLAALTVLGADGEARRLPADALVVLQGLSPRLGPIADWQLALERKQLVVDTEKFQTSAPGIYAIGDINTYPGKRKLILSGFHEATLAAYAAQAQVAPQHPLPFAYTTSSTRLHRLLEGRAPSP